MNKVTLVLFFPVLCAVACSQDVDQQLNASENAVHEFANSLKSKLKNSLQSGGPVEAIGVCNIEAPKIASEISQKHVVQIGRTSLKTRNPLNAPDNWEQEILQEFEQQKQSDASIKDMQTYQIIKDETGKWFRYMKAIPTAEVCLICHGESIAPPIETKLKELYPNDLATGYRVGEIRGAFTVKIKL